MLVTTDEVIRLGVRILPPVLSMYYTNTVGAIAKKKIHEPIIVSEVSIACLYIEISRELYTKPYSHHLILVTLIIILIIDKKT